jgi:hypothetical protein
MDVQGVRASMKQTQAEISSVALVRMLRRLAEKRRRKYDPTRLYQGEATLKRSEKGVRCGKAIKGPSCGSPAAG